MLKDALRVLPYTSIPPEQLLANRLDDVRAKVVREIIQPELKAHGMLKNRAETEHRVVDLVYEELKSFNEGDLRQLLTSFVALNLTAELPG